IGKTGLRPFCAGQSLAGTLRADLRSAKFAPANLCGPCLRCRRQKARLLPPAQQGCETPMKILILGAGQVGRPAASHLSPEEANEVTVVDINEDALRDLQERLEVRTVVGNAAHPTVLEAAGAGEADVMVALTSSDEVNLMACEVAFALYRTPTKIARIR